MIYAEYETLMTIELLEKIFRFLIGVDAFEEHIPDLFLVIKLTFF